MDRLLENGIVRIKDLVENKNVAVILISACRGFYNMFPDYRYSDNEIKKHDLDVWREDNNKRTNLLEAQIKKNKYGYIKVIGGYVEDGIGEVEEKSFMVFARGYNQEELFNFGIEMCRVFEQDSVLLIDSNTHNAKYVDKDGINTHILPDLNVFDIDQNSLSKYFSKIGTRKNNRRFQIIEIEEKLSSAGSVESMGFNGSYLVDASRLWDDKYRKFFEKKFKDFLKEV